MRLADADAADALEQLEDVLEHLNGLYRATRALDQVAATRSARIEYATRWADLPQARDLSPTPTTPSPQQRSLWKPPATPPSVSSPKPCSA